MNIKLVTADGCVKWLVEPDGCKKPYIETPIMPRFSFRDGGVPVSGCTFSARRYGYYRTYEDYLEYREMV